MIFPVIQLEASVQESDKTRLVATKSYITPDEAAITLVEIEPHTGDGYIDVTTNLYLDWQYPTDGEKTVTLRVTTDGAPESLIKTIMVLSVADDKLFSSDQDLMPYEPELLNWVRAGRNSFLDVHRASQDRILTYLDEKRIWDTNGDRLTLDAITDVVEVKDWSKFMTLRLIFEGISNATDDVFHEKALRYKALEVEARNRAALRLDRDGDGETDVTKLDMRSIFMVRR
jgi:hypothetical protein